MILPLKSLRPLTLSLALASAAIAFGIAQRAWVGTQADALLATPAQKFPPTQFDISAPQLKASVEPIRDHALFHATRAFYVAPPAPAAPLTPPRPDYLLAGTFIIPRKPTVALLTQRAGGASRKVYAGDDLDGWHVQSVEAGRVVLEFNGHSMEIVRDSRASGVALTRAPLSRPAQAAVASSSSEPGASSGPPPSVRTLGNGANGRGTMREASAAPTESRVEARLYRPPPQ